MKIADIEPLAVGTEAQAVSAEDFWREPTLEELAEEQGFTGRQRLDSVIGAAAGLWEDDTDAASFVEEIYERRRKGREPEGGGR